MAQIAVTILDPTSHRSAHLVETRLPVRDIIPPIAAQLRLPERATYQLFPLGSEHALPADESFAELGVPAGAELQLKPVRNPILKAILDKLYDEAKEYVEEQAWEFAKGKLEELLALDPTYPDPLALEAAVAAHAGALRSVPQGTPPTERLTPPSQSPRSQATSTPRPFAASASGMSRTTMPTAPSTPPSPANPGRAYQLTPEAAKRSGASCLGVTLMIVGVVVAGSLALVAARFFLPSFLDNMAARLGVALPGTVVLGTGDVQVTLRWTGDADLDLHVVDPNDEEIWFANAQSASGGELDVDANGSCEGLARPVENVYWPIGRAPAGTYEVYVQYYQLCDVTAPVDYEVTITLDGEVMDRINAQITNVGEQHPVSSFDY